MDSCVLSVGLRSVGVRFRFADYVPIRLQEVNFTLIATWWDWCSYPRCRERLVSGRLYVGAKEISSWDAICILHTI